MVNTRWLCLFLLAVSTSVHSERDESFEDAGDIDQEEHFEPAFDVGEDNRVRDLEKALKSEEITTNDESAKSISIWTAFGELFKTGDGRRYSILNLAYQLSCYQGRGGSMMREALWAFQKYHTYGCYCGSSHYSGNYIDATDRCCKEHNECYRKAKKKYNIGNACHVFTTKYYVSCCKKKKYTKCTDSGPSAARALCNCDQKMAKCMSRKRTLQTYKKKYRKNRKKCHATSPNFHKRATTSILGIFKQCKVPSTPIRKFPIKYGSQGKCPASKKKKKSSGWWIFGRDQ